jgi:hypothetical protein
MATGLDQMVLLLACQRLGVVSTATAVSTAKEVTFSSAACLLDLKFFTEIVITLVIYVLDTTFVGKTVTLQHYHYYL